MQITMKIPNLPSDLPFVLVCSRQTAAFPILFGQHQISTQPDQSDQREDHLERTQKSPCKWENLFESNSRVANMRP